MSELPAQIGPYQVIGPLGGGGFSQVLLGRDLRPGQGRALVAIKRVRPDLPTTDPLYRRSIVLEGRVAGAIDLPHFARISDLLAVDGEPVVVMEYVPGFSLDRLLTRVARRGVPAAWVAEIGVQLAQALGALHALGTVGSIGFVHQDLKPSNIRITPGGVVKVLDLGIAAPIHRPLKRIRQGTPGYRSPEQARGERRLGPASDLYALGILLFELALGLRLFPERVARDPEALQIAQATIAERLAEKAAVLPPGLTPLLLALLAPDPLARIQSADEALGRLRAWRASIPLADQSFSAWCAEVAAEVGERPVAVEVAPPPEPQAPADLLSLPRPTPAAAEPRIPLGAQVVGVSVLVAVVFLGGVLLGSRGAPHVMPASEDAGGSVAEIAAPVERALTAAGEDQDARDRSAP